MSTPDHPEYTLILPHDAACDLILGIVRHDVLVACISAVKALHETPAELIESLKQRKRRKTRAEAAA